MTPPKPRYQPLDSRMLSDPIIIEGQNRVPLMTPQELEECKQRYRERKKLREELERARIEVYRRHQQHTNGASHE